MLQDTFCMIKPEGIRRHEEIIEELRSSKFSVIAGVFMFWEPDRTEHFVRMLYPGAPEIITKATVAHFAHQTSICMVIRGENVIPRFIQKVGAAIDPNACKEGTLRRTFGIKEPHILGDNKTFFWRNAIHRPKTRKEFDIGIEVALALEHKPELTVVH